MALLAIAIAAGVALALVAGGRPTGTAPHALRWVPALLAAAAAQWVPEVADVPETAGFLAVLCSYAAVLAFTARNLAHPGMPVALLGVALNVAVTVPNGGMPVRADAIVRAGIATPEEVEGIGLGARRHLESDDDVLTPLGDVIAVPPLREVVSVGDVVLAAGLAVVAFRTVRPRRARVGSATALPATGGSGRLGGAAPARPGSRREG